MEKLIYVCTTFCLIYLQIFNPFCTILHFICAEFIECMSYGKWNMSRISFSKATSIIQTCYCTTTLPRVRWKIQFSWASFNIRHVRLFSSNDWGKPWNNKNQLPSFLKTKETVAPIFILAPIIFMISIFVREINYHDRNDDNNEFGVIILETLLVLNIYLYFRNPVTKVYCACINIARGSFTP